MNRLKGCFDISGCFIMRIRDTSTQLDCEGAKYSYLRILECWVELSRSRKMSWGLPLLA